MTSLAPSPARPRPQAFAFFTIALGAVGWFAAWELLTEYIKTLQTPGYQPNCNVSVLVTCGPNMDSWQGSVLGFSNTVLGVAAFMAPIFIGFALLAGAQFARWFWTLYQLGLLIGIIFVFWLAVQSVFALGTLCPWCLVIWGVTIPLFWATLFRPIAVGDIMASPRVQQIFSSLYAWTWVFSLTCYIVIAAFAQVNLNWLAELVRAF
jgi:uncharacterized membrane protein